MQSLYRKETRGYDREWLGLVMSEEGKERGSECVVTDRVDRLANRDVIMTIVSRNSVNERERTIRITQGIMRMKR